MLRCYFFAASMGSSVDRDTQITSLFGLADSIAVAGPTWPASQRVALEVHAFFEGEGAEPERDNHEFRIAWISEGHDEVFGVVNRIPSGAARVRIRGMATTLPPWPGAYVMKVDLRPVREGGEATWQRQAVSWPIAFNLVTPPSIPPPENG